ncbi:MAG TPA: hypothetical protein VMA86_11645, partial [Acetobacteraceae bacterium]|nr:hypothetical protein [Acetobacteraceae bacterium]
MDLLPTALGPTATGARAGMNALGASPASGPSIWADVEDLFDYARANPRPSGIQRQAFEIQRSLQASLAATGRLRFVRHAGRAEAPLLREVAWEEVEGLFARLTHPPQDKPHTKPGGPSPPSGTGLLAVRHRLG